MTNFNPHSREGSDIPCFPPVLLPVQEESDIIYPVASKACLLVTALFGMSVLNGAFLLLLFCLSPII